MARKKKKKKKNKIKSMD